jgi:membrane-associated phospholipid phosphatase
MGLLRGKHAFPCGAKTRARVHDQERYKRATTQPLALPFVSTLERIWFAYLAIMAAVGLCTGAGGDAAYQPARFAGALAAILVLQLVAARLGGKFTPAKHRVVRALAACVCIPIAYTAVGWVLPAVHPEPYEWVWLHLDRAVFGCDPTVVLQRLRSPPLIEVLQLVYASFYLIPIAAILVVARCNGSRAFDRALTLLTFGFLTSYCGYLLLPTLPPSRFLDHGASLQGVWCAADLHHWLEAAEGNRWDCFPSGHTMLSLMSLAVIWRWARRWTWLFLVIVLPLVFSTMMLRYHWSWDVLAGGLLVWPTLRLGDLLLARDGAPVP